jgi:SAM-dependent methyltransferase/uncharacterized protein YbaR (Trm112 family)
MRYSLLSYLRCAVCRDGLACFVSREVSTSISPFVAETAPRAPAVGHAFAPSPAFVARTPLAARLAALAGPAAPGRNREAAIQSGVLICGGCARWFPIVDGLPELLPDHLRNPARDAALLDTVTGGLPSDLRQMLRHPDAGGAGAEDTGAHYKRAEINILSRIEDRAGFFGPGYSAPFNPGNTEFTLYLISLFANVVKLLDVKDHSQRAVVLDSGCGYAWTTEWLAKSGLETIGVDICRAYLEIGIRRMGESHPHLIVADVENLPIADGCADAVLAYESFHHIPDRGKAMAGYARILRDGAAVVLAEPGAAHETAAVSLDTMTKYGILEKGMELEDVETYVAGSPFAPPEQHYVLLVSTDELALGITLPSAWRHSIFPGNVFRVRKDAARTGTAGATRPARPSDASDLPKSPTTFEELRILHERTTREWNAEVQRLSGEVHAITANLHAAQRTLAGVERSVFWKVRRGWVRLAGFFGSQRGDTRREW